LKLKSNFCPLYAASDAFLSIYTFPHRPENDSQNVDASSAYATQLVPGQKRFSSGIMQGFNTKAKLISRKAYVRTRRAAVIALYYTLVALPVPKTIHDFFWRGNYFNQILYHTVIKDIRLPVAAETSKQ